MVVRSPTPFGLGRNGCWHSCGSQLPRALLNECRKAARNLFEIGRLSSLFSCLCLARLRLLILLLLLLLMSGNVYPNPCPVFPCSVCAGNVTWPGRSVQCCTRSKWIHLKCLLVSFSRFRILTNLTPGGPLPAWSLLLLEIPHLLALWLPSRNLSACISPLFNLAPLAPLC